MYTLHVSQFVHGYVVFSDALHQICPILTNLLMICDNPYYLRIRTMTVML